MVFLCKLRQTMLIIYIVRHGQTEENLQRILQGHMPGTLTEQGKEQVQRAAEQLSTKGVRFTRIVSSDLKRAMDSAQIIADKLKLPIIPMEILRERDWGKFTGMPIADAMEKYHAHGKWKFPSGTIETEAGIYERAKKTLKELKAQFADETLIVVTHGQFARNLIAAHFNCNYHEVATFMNAEIRMLSI